jgi:tetratricopeptide (TPR) repeat protein
MVVGRIRRSYLQVSGRLMLLAIATIFSITGTAAAQKVSGKVLVDIPVTGYFNEKSQIKQTEADKPRVTVFKLIINPVEVFTIDAQSDEFNARLRIIDGKGKILIEDEDGGIGHNARLIIRAKQFTPAMVKDLRIELTSQGDWDMGSYKILMARGELPTPHGKEKTEADIAYCEQAAALAATKEAYQRQGWALATLAWNYSLIGSFEKLRENAIAAKALAEQVGDKKLLALALKNIGAASWYKGKGKDAIPYFEKALAIRREIGDRKGEANSLDNLGIAYQQLKEHDRSIEYFQKALSIYRELGDQRGESNELGNLGIAFHLVGDHNQAIEHYSHALELRHKVGDRRGQAYDLCNLGVAYAKLGRYQRAIIYYELAVEIHRELGDRRGEGRDLENLAKACVFVGDVQRAVEVSKEAERIKRELSSGQ